MAHRFLHAIRAMFKRSRFESELDAELADHLDKRTDDLVRQGMTHPAAALRARQEFGAVEAVKDGVRDSSGVAVLDTLMRNLRYAVRSLWQHPAYAFTMIGTLALCIGANAAIYSVVDVMLFRPLPYPEPDQMGSLIQKVREKDGFEWERDAIDGAGWEWMRKNVTSLDLAIRRGVEGVNLVTGTGQAEFVQQRRVSAGYFDVLGMKPLIGRVFTEEEDVSGGPALAVLSQPLWARLFHSDPNIVGKSILLRGEPFTVTGVMPADFETTYPAVDLWAPVHPSTTGEGAGLNYEFLGRVREGYTPEQAQAELAALADRYNESEAKARNTYSPVISLELRPLLDWLSLRYRRQVLLLWVAVGVVLLIGCLNLAGVALARGTARRQEIATRLALGSGRAGIMSQLITESGLLGLAGGALGLAVGYGAIELLRPMITEALHPPQPIEMDGRVLAATSAITIFTVVLVGLQPAWAAAKTDLRAAMGSRSTTRRSHWTRRMLVAAEVALAMVLLVSAGLVLRTLWNWQRLVPGFDARNVMTASLSLRDARYQDNDAVLRLYEESLREIRATPGVAAAGIGLSLPYETSLNAGARIVDGPTAMEKAAVTDFVYATPGYFDALRFRLVSGRWLEQADREDAPRVALVNEAYVRQYFHGENPIGRHLNLSPELHEVVGVVADVQQHANWGGFGLVGNVPTVYLPAAQVSGLGVLHGYLSPHWVVRTQGTVANLPHTMRAAVASVDPQLPFAEFRSMERVQAGAFSTERMETWLLGSLAGLALLLAGIGVYGLITQAVIERTREFGLRMALGASSGSVVMTVTRPAFLLCLAGVIGGVLLSRASSAWIGSLLFGVEPGDPWTIVVVAGVLLGSAAVASLVPSFRITRLNPAETLREE